MATVYEIEHRFADVWIARDDDNTFDYYYGGTRMVSPSTENAVVRDTLDRLMLYESSLKNHLINMALRQGILDNYGERLPNGFLTSAVGGARCIIRPRDVKTAAALSTTDNSGFYPTISAIFETIGELLNREHGKIKLTPDFGRFAGLADILFEYTPHVLGIRCEIGGCGGKSSYSTTGILSALEVIEIHRYRESPVTLIGSAGAMGSDVLKYFLQEGYKNLAICDLVYDNQEYDMKFPQAVLKLR